MNRFWLERMYPYLGLCKQVSIKALFRLYRSTLLLAAINQSYQFLPSKKSKRRSASRRKRRLKWQTQHLRDWVSRLSVAHTQLNCSHNRDDSMRFLTFRSRRLTQTRFSWASTRLTLRMKVNKPCLLRLALKIIPMSKQWWLTSDWVLKKPVSLSKQDRISTISLFMRSLNKVILGHTLFKSHLTMWSQLKTEISFKLYQAKNLASKSR